MVVLVNPLVGILSITLLLVVLFLAVAAMEKYKRGWLLLVLYVFLWLFILVKGFMWLMVSFIMMIPFVVFVGYAATKKLLSK